MRFLMVALGGALGAVCRYSISLIPFKGTFPLLTLLTNTAGAVLIGVIIGAAMSGDRVSDNTLLFLKVGVCGGFTTFSTFSAESLTLFEKGHTVLCALYIALSVALCIAGVWVGKRIVL